MRWTTRSSWHRYTVSGLLAFCWMGGLTEAQESPRSRIRPPDPVFVVDGSVALASLMALSDGHLQKMAGFLEVVASGIGDGSEWSSIRKPLSRVEAHNVPAVLWFARRDGSYWTLRDGAASGNLSQRAYFPKLMAGKTVMGDLVVSASTRRSVAIVAVPVRGRDGTIIGALGSSIYLDSLSRMLDQEMALPDGLTFYSIDATPIGALNRNLDLIFTRPLTLGEDLSRAIREMLRHDEGVVAYRFLDAQRTVIYRRSPVTGWWYAVGTVKPQASIRVSR